MSDPRAISHGEKSSNKGERGITKRLDALATLTPLTGHRLLDIGCADGSYTRRLAEGFDQVDAIDIEVERLDDFREAGPGWIAVAEMSADALSYPDNTFDVITAIEVMEHVGDVDAVLAEVARVLVPGGRFLVTTPNRWFPFETHKPIIAGEAAASVGGTGSAVDPGGAPEVLRRPCVHGLGAGAPSVRGRPDHDWPHLHHAAVRCLAGGQADPSGHRLDRRLLVVVPGHGAGRHVREGLAAQSCPLVDQG
jgi:SAM-dependent methyltransferase